MRHVWTEAELNKFCLPLPYDYLVPARGANLPCYRCKKRTPHLAQLTQVENEGHYYTAVLWTWCATCSHGHETAACRTHVYDSPRMLRRYIRWRAKRGD